MAPLELHRCLGIAVEVTSNVYPLFSESSINGHEEDFELLKKRLMAETQHAYLGPSWMRPCPGWPPLGRAQRARREPQPVNRAGNDRSAGDADALRAAEGEFMSTSFTESSLQECGPMILVSVIGLDRSLR